MNGGSGRRTHEELGEGIELEDLGREVVDLVRTNVERSEVLKPHDRLGQPFEVVLSQGEDPQVVESKERGDSLCGERVVGEGEVERDAGDGGGGGAGRGVERARGGTGERAWRSRRRLIKGEWS